MPHPIYGPAKHDLEVVELKVYLPSRRNGFHTRLEVQGTCETKRSALWTYGEMWTADQQQSGYQPTDAVNLLVLTSFQDRPASQEALQRSLAPGAWEDTPLPF